MAEIKNVQLTSIDSNPWRMKHKYPLKANKIKALVHSIELAGCWEGVIGRKKGNRYELAFGHHRVAAAAKAGLKRIPLIVRDLTDEQMLRLMGLENGEDYATDFLLLLNSWEAAKTFKAARGRALEPQPAEIARLLGWTRDNKRPGLKDNGRPNDTANACHAALTLIEGGHIDRSELDGLSVFTVREIVQKQVAQHERLEKMGKKKEASRRDIETSKRRVDRAAKTTIKELKSPTKKKDDARAIRHQIDHYTHEEYQKDSGPKAHEAAVMLKILNDRLAKILDSDANARDLKDLKKALPFLGDDEDAVRGIERSVFELDGLSKRSIRIGKSLKMKKGSSKRGGKVVALKSVSAGKGA